jgi:hypothetical protein
MMQVNIGTSFGAAVVSLVLFEVVAAADTITIVDLTDTITLTQSDNRATILCTGENDCAITLLAPAGSSFDNANSQALAGATLVDPNTTLVSDAILSFASQPQLDQASINFASDGEGVSNFTCALCPAEDGTAQPALTIAWDLASGGMVTDTINIQSDPSPSEVPEPSSLLLSGTVIAVLLFGGRRAARGRRENGATAPL